MKRRTVFLTALVAVGLAAVSPLLRTDSGLTGVEVVERWSLDTRFLLRGPRAPHPDLALVVFDDATAHKAGPLFERRAGWAQVIRAIASHHPKVIGVDAVFDMPERLLGQGLQDRVEAWKRERDGGEPLPLLEDIASELSGDAELARALSEAGNVALIVSEDTAGAAAPLSKSLNKARYGQSVVGDGVSELGALVTSRPEFVSASAAMGLATVTEDGTRTVRSVDFARVKEGAAYMPFAAAVVELGLGLTRGQLVWSGPTHEVTMGELTVPLEGTQLWLDFPGPSGTVPTYSVIDVVNGAVSDEALRGKWVLLGVTRFGYDLTRTPFGPVPGVEVQASVVDDVLRGRHLTRRSRSEELGLVLLLGLLMAAVFLPPWRPQVQVGAGLALIAAWLVTTSVALSQASLWLPCVVPAGVMLVCLFAGLGLSYSSEAGQRRELRKAFTHYVGEDVLDDLVLHPEKLALGGEKRTLTVLFSDIRDFTTLSEKLSPVELVSFLNTYLSPMTRAVLKQGGLLDKYIGDAVMAVFGAPVKREDHAAQALRCIARMHEELKALNDGPLKRFGIEVAIGVGLNTGDMVVGNMGSEERFDYTVAGDSVNLASRLEGLSKVYGVHCLVGDATVRAAGPGFIFRELDLVQVKGKHEAVAVHELLEVEGVVISRRQELDAWGAGVTAFRAGQLGTAREAFARYEKSNPGDLAVERYLARLKELPDVAPADFNAVTAFKSK